MSTVNERHRVRRRLWPLLCVALQKRFLRGRRCKEGGGSARGPSLTLTASHDRPIPAGPSKAWHVSSPSSNTHAAAEPPICLSHGRCLSLGRQPHRMAGNVPSLTSAITNEIVPPPQHTQQKQLVPIYCAHTVSTTCAHTVSTTCAHTVSTTCAHTAKTVSKNS